MNPSLSIPATEVSDDWLNDVQEELTTVIEGQGITLVKGTQDQLQAALLLMIGAGGTNTKLDPLLNNTADQNITGLIFDKLVTKAAIMFMDVNRQTTTNDVQETMIVMATHDTKNNLWQISTILTAFDDSGTTLTIDTGTGQVKASTDTLAGASYLAQARVTGVIRFSL